MDMTWDDYIRWMLLDIFITPILLVTCVLMLNAVQIWSLGGLDGMRELMRADGVAAKAARQKEEEETQQLRWQEMWRSQRGNSGDDNDAK